MARQGKEKRFGNSRLTRRAPAENEGLKISGVERLIYARDLEVDNYLTSKTHFNISSTSKFRVFKFKKKKEKKKKKKESSRKIIRSAVFSSREVYLLKAIILKLEIKVSYNLSTLKFQYFRSMKIK